METMTGCSARVAVTAPLMRHSPDIGHSALQSVDSWWIRHRLLRAVVPLLVFALAMTVASVAAQAQTNPSGNTTARFNKRVFVPAMNERLQLQDAVPVSYTLTPTDTGSQLTLLCQYNGVGEGETSGQTYTLVGTDQQSATLPSPVATSAVIHSSAMLTQVGSSLSVAVRVDYLITVTEDGDLIISITGLEVAQ